MAFISGFLGLGTSLNGGVLAEPTGSDYARQPIFFDFVVGGVALNTLNCVFGPTTGSWGTLVAFMVFDGAGNSVYSGTLNQPLTPTVGELLNVPVGGVALNLSVPLPGGVVLSGFQSTIPAASSYPAGAVLTPPTAAGGTPGSTTVTGAVTPAINAYFGNLPISPDGSGLPPGQVYINGSFLAVATVASGITAAVASYFASLPLSITGSGLTAGQAYLNGGFVAVASGAPITPTSGDVPATLDFYLASLPLSTTGGGLEPGQMYVNGSFLAAVSGTPFLSQTSEAVAFAANAFFRALPASSTGSGLPTGQMYFDNSFVAVVP